MTKEGKCRFVAARGEAAGRGLKLRCLMILHDNYTRQCRVNLARTMETMQATWWLYLLECETGLLYIGITKDVEGRFDAHRNGTGAMFTRLNKPVRILGKAALATKGEALRAEYALKQLSRREKLAWCAAGLESFVLERG